MRSLQDADNRSKSIPELSSGELIYEVRLEIEPAILAEFDRWLEGHVAEILALPGFERADLETEVEKEPTPAHAGNAVRTVRYLVRDRAALDDYLDSHAPAMRKAAMDRFGDRFTATRRVLESTPLGDHERPVLPHCRNCDARMRGQYCARCGQRARLRMITLWELLRDVVGEIFEHDSRVWRSLIPLLFRPGYLTSEYLAGRQMRYMPPVRMYLFLSIVFFVVAALGPDDGVLQSEGAFTFSDTPPADVGEEPPIRRKNSSATSRRTSAPASAGSTGCSRENASSRPAGRLRQTTPRRSSRRSSTTCRP